MIHSSGVCIVLACVAFSRCLAQQPQNETRESKTASHNQFGPVLQRVLASSADRFRGLEGARIENRKRDHFFEAKLYLPEANYCRIFNQGDLVYCCEWRDKGYSGSKIRYQA